MPAASRRGRTGPSTRSRDLGRNGGSPCELVGRSRPPSRRRPTTQYRPWAQSSSRCTRRRVHAARGQAAGEERDAVEAAAQARRAVGVALARVALHAGVGARARADVPGTPGPQWPLWHSSPTVQGAPSATERPPMHTPASEQSRPVRQVVVAEHAPPRPRPAGTGGSGRVRRVVATGAARGEDGEHERHETADEGGHEGLRGTNASRPEANRRTLPWRSSVLAVGVGVLPLSPPGSSSGQPCSVYR